MAAASFPLPTLSKLMEGKNTLHGWDVLVSYDEDTLNSLLSTHLKDEGGTVIPITGLTYTDDLTGAIVTASVSLSIHEVHLQFVDSAGTVEVYMSFSATETLNSAGTMKTKEIPLGNRIAIKTNLETLSIETKADNPTVLAIPRPVGTVHSFKMSEDPTAYWVAVNFQAIDVVIQADPRHTVGSSPTEAARLDALLSAWLKVYYENLKEPKLVLAGTSNQKLPLPVNNGSSYAVFVPRACAFTCIPGNQATGTKSTLCIWESLAGSGSEPESLDQSNFAVADPNAAGAMTPALPIPTGCSASVIISNTAFINLILKPALVQPGRFTSVTQISQTETPGINLQLGVPSTPLGWPDGPWADEFKLSRIWNAVSIDSAQTPAVLSFTSGIFVQTVPRIGFTYSTPQVSESFLTFEDFWKTAQMGFSLGGTIKYGDEGSADFAFDIALDPTYSHLNSCNPDDWDKITALGDQWQINPLPFMVNPPCNLAPLTGVVLDLKLVTNVLLPGEVVFQADPMFADTDQSSIGMSIPRDVIFTGKIASPSTAKETLAIRQTRAWAQPGATRPVATTLLDTLLEEYKNELWNSADLSLFFGIIKATSAGSQTTIKQYLTSKGFGNLSADLLLRGMGLTASDIVGAVVSPNVGAAKDTAGFDIDLRFFAGLYTITSPSADAGKLILINPFTKTIKILGTDVVPTQKVDSNGRKTEEFSASAQGREWHIIVKAYVDDTTGSIVLSLGGSVTGSTTETFSAVWKSTNGPSTLESASNTRKTQTVEELRGPFDGWRDRFFALLSLICCCAGASQHAAQEAAAQEIPDAPRSLVLSRNARQLAQEELDRATEYLRGVQERSIQREAETRSAQALRDSYNERQRIINSRIVEMSDDDAVEIKTALDGDYDAVLAHNAEYLSLLQQSRDAAARSSRTLVTENLSASDAAYLENEMQDVDLSDNAAYIPFAEAAVSAAAASSAQEVFEVGSQSARQLGHGIGQALATRYSTNVGNLANQITEDKANLDEVKKANEVARKAIERAREEQQPPDVIEKMEADLATRETAARNEEERIARAETERDEQSEDARESRESADRYPEEETPEEPVEGEEA